jgi:hypothetical protein
VLGVRDQGQYKSRSFGEIIRKTFPLAVDSPFEHRFHESVCRQAAQMITSWAQQIIQLAIDEHRRQQKQEAAQRAADETTPEEQKQEKYVPTLTDVYRAWAAQEHA